MHPSPLFPSPLFPPLLSLSSLPSLPSFPSPLSSLSSFPPSPLPISFVIHINLNHITLLAYYLCFHMSCRVYANFAPASLTQPLTHTPTPYLHLRRSARASASLSTLSITSPITYTLTHLLPPSPTPPLTQACAG